jgi:hypothetical protein
MDFPTSVEIHGSTVTFEVPQDVGLRLRALDLERQDDPLGAGCACLVICWSKLRANVKLHGGARGWADRAMAALTAQGWSLSEIGLAADLAKVHVFRSLPTMEAQKEAEDFSEAPTDAPSGLSAE